MLTDLKKTQKNKGFALIEAIVALTVLGLVWGACIHVVSASPAALRKSESSRLAVLAAKSLLARVGVEIPVQTGSWNGEFKGGGSWRLAIAPYKQRITINDSHVPEKGMITHPYIVQIHASYGKGKSKAEASVVTIRREGVVN